jgi:hypothetical protein
MVLVVGSHFVELILERPYAGLAVDELAIAVRFIVEARVVNDRDANGVIDPAGEIERQM